LLKASERHDNIHEIASILSVQSLRPFIVHVRST
jgi:hypothetical protein